MEKEFRSKEICEKSGATRTQLSPWVAAGAIVPLIDDPRRGGVRIYSRQNLVEAMICKELANYSLPVRSIAEILKTMRNKRFKFGGIKENSRKVWEMLKENPVLCLLVGQEGSIVFPSGAEEFKKRYPGRSRTGKNAVYIVMLKERGDKYMATIFSSAILINLEPMLRLAGMIEEEQPL